MIIELAMVVAMQTQTTCRTAFGTTTCDSRPTGFGAYNEGLRAGSEMGRSMQPRQPRDPRACAGRDWWLVGCTRGEHDAGVRDRDAAAAGSALTQQVATMIGDGDCEGAIQTALRAGNMDLAREARDFCNR